MNKVLSGLFWKFGERISAQLVTFIVSIVLARLLSPDDYGNIALVTVFITIANVFVVNGFGSALIQKQEADNVDFSSVFYANIVFSCFLYVIIFTARCFSETAFPASLITWEIPTCPFKCRSKV